jgi:hypothetical protein
MPANTYTGEVPLQLAGRTFVLVYDWTALARVKSEIGDDALKLVLDGGDPASLAKVIAAGLARHHPEMSDAAVMAASPPLVPTVAKVKEALAYAYWGPKGEPEETKENPPGRMARLRTRLSQLFGSRAEPV